MSPIYLGPSCTTTLHSDRTTRRALRAISHRSFVPTPTEKNSLHHHGSRSHDDVDTDTESKCDTGCASLENHVLCVAVIPKAEGHIYFQKYVFCNKRRPLHFRPSLGEKPANLERVRRIPSDTWRPRSQFETNETCRVTDVNNDPSVSADRRFRVC